MYLRTVTARTKDGPVQYLQLAHNFRNPTTGQSQPRILYNFGRLDQVDRAALERLAHSIRRFLEPADAAGLRSALQEQGLSFCATRSLGGAWLLDRLWHRLGLDRALTRHGLDAELERAVFTLVANRALAPSSKLSVTDWSAEEAWIPGWQPPALPEPDDEEARLAERKRRANVLYRAMDALAEGLDAVQTQVFRAISGGSFLDLDVDLLYFDTTTTYWEIEDEDEGDGEGRPGLRCRGHTKDDRADAPQVVIGLAVTRAGIPIRCWVWPGNTADVTVIGQVKRDLVGWRLGRVITVVDRGFVSEENLRVLQEQGGHYIAGERMRSGKAAVREALGRAGRYRQVRQGLEVKEVLVGEGEARRRYVVVRNPAEAERDRRRREAVLAELAERLRELEGLTGDRRLRREAELLADEGYRRYLRRTASGVLAIDRDQVAAEARLDGKYLLRTSDDTLSAEDVALGYRQLQAVERAFRTLKTTLDLRPVYHRLADRIRAHVLLCWLALLLVRVAEEKTGLSWPVLRREFERMAVVVFQGPGGGGAQRTVTTGAQRRVLQALGLEEPPMVFALSPKGSRAP